MKFIHMADLHIGGWREPKMSLLTVKAFESAVDDCISQNIDFLIIAGDIFNTSLPGIDYIKETVKHLKRLKTAQIPVYIVPGSHDFSPSGKTMLDVLEQADFLINVARARIREDGKIELQFTIDKKTGAKITGMLGKKNMLERSYYESLDMKKFESEQGFKIFLFHTAIDELKPGDMAKMESSPLTLLPKGFDYYAGGHVHIIDNKSFQGYKNVIYPGPLFPNSFSEIEKLGSGSYLMYDDGVLTSKKIILKPVQHLFLDCDGRSAEQINSEISAFVDCNRFDDCIVLMKLSGKLRLGRLTDIDFKNCMHKMYEKGAYFIMKNVSSLLSPDFEEIKRSFNIASVEEDVISEHLGQTKVEGLDVGKEKELITILLQQLSKEKAEGETVATYEERILKDINLL